MSSISPVSFASYSGMSSIGSAKPLALTALALLTLSNLPKADAGPLAYMACYASCMAASNAATYGAFLPASQLFCQNLCLPALAAPSP